MDALIYIFTPVLATIIVSFLWKLKEVKTTNKVEKIPSHYYVSFFKKSYLVEPVIDHDGYRVDYMNLGDKKFKISFGFVKSDQWYVKQGESLVREVEENLSEFSEDLILEAFKNYDCNYFETDVFFEYISEKYDIDKELITPENIEGILKGTLNKKIHSFSYNWEIVEFDGIFCLYSFSKKEMIPLRDGLEIGDIIYKKGSKFTHEGVNFEFTGDSIIEVLK